MKTNDYKKKFIDLFKEMEQELGDCNTVEIEREDEFSFTGDIVSKSYACRIRF
jgi:hypothetical protein